MAFIIEEAEHYTCGPGPANEECVPAPYQTTALRTEAIAECKRYRDMLDARFPLLPNGMWFTVQRQPYHNGGYYIEVVLRYVPDDTVHAAVFAVVEANLPDTWEDTQTIDTHTVIPALDA